MIRTIIISICFFTLHCISTMNTYSQGFTVSGTKLLDANGNEFIIRGVNNPHSWYLSKSVESLDLIASYNVNCIRIVWQSDDEVKKLEKIIKSCIKLQMIPMVELHNATGNNATGKLLELTAYYARNDVKEMLFKYKKYILINIANEWGDYFMTGDQWKDDYKLAVDYLRKAGYETTLVIDAPNWGQKIEPIFDYGKELLEFDPKHNLLFSIHMYGFWNDRQKVDTSLQKAYDLSLPLIVGEFGYNFDNGNNNLKCMVDHTFVLSKCCQLGYGYIPWSWSGNDEKNAWLNITKPEDWKTLTWWGKEVLEGENGISKTSKKASIFKSP
jgi:mannan endo-1,4-beta-mannosidase